MSNVIEYTEAEVILKCHQGDYVVSNVNTRGEPGGNCTCHLMSIEISSPAYESGSTNSCGTTGKVSLIDYKNAVFSHLTEHMRYYLSNTRYKDAGRAELCPKITITMNCFSGKRVWNAYINDWHYQFTGTTPTLEIDFICVSPNSMDLPKVEDGISTIFDYEPCSSNFEQPVEYLKEVYRVFGTSMRLTLQLNGDVKLYDENAAAKIIFPVGGIKYKPAKAVGLLHCLSYFAQYGKYQENEYTSEIPLSAMISDDGTEFILLPVNLAPANSNSKYLFVQNGKHKAYTVVDGKSIIPMTSFSFEANMPNLGVAQRIIDCNSANAESANMSVADSSPKDVNSNNGVIIQQNDGTAKQTSDSVEQANASLDGARYTASADLINVSFDCYNITSFKVNNLNEKISIRVYDELGGKIEWLDTELTVRQVSYSLSGGVVKAHVEGTTVFNHINGKPSTGGRGSGGGKGKSNKDKSKQQLYQENKEFIDYITSEDEFPIPLEYDNTMKYYWDKSHKDKLTNYIRKFIADYGNLTGHNRNLDYSFIKSLIDDGIYGLLALLFGTAYYGVKEPIPTYWKTTKEYKWGNDPHRGCPGKGSHREFLASDTGKTLYDYVSGLSIPDWDGGNQGHFYNTFGFPAKFDDYKEGLEKDKARHGVSKFDLKAQVNGKDVTSLSELEKAYEHILIKSGSISWVNHTYYDYENDKKLSRRKPVFKDAKLNKIFPSPKSDSYPLAARHYDYWRAWAYLVSYNKSMQIDMVRYWMEDVWGKVIDLLKKRDAAAEKAANGHVICLQDAIRLSKIQNSKPAEVTAIFNQNLLVKTQYENYSSRDAEAALSHFAYCQRLCRIIEWELNPENNMSTGEQQQEESNYSSNEEQNQSHE